MIAISTSIKFSMLWQGRTRPLDNVPEELLEGLHLVLGKGNTTLFMGTVDKNTVTWSLSSKVPQSKAAELNALFEDAGRAQVTDCTWIHDIHSCLSKMLSIIMMLHNHVNDSTAEDPPGIYFGI